MGLIRLLLAISVIMAHSSPILGLTLVQGQLAVEIFFMISGFYMALILSEKYTKKSDYKLFISNRFLKIFPTYWITLMICLIYQVIYLYLNPNSPNIFALFNPRFNLNPFTFITFLISNLIIFGQDVLLFFGLNTTTGALFFTSNFRLFKPETFNFFFIAQAWTLSLELTFYFLAPFLNRFKNKYLLLIMSLSFGLRLFIYSQGLNHDPWNYRFFPTELIFFLSGILMYRIYKYIQLKPFKKLSIYSFLFYISFLIYYQYLPHERTKQLILFLFSFIFIPFIFNLFKTNKIDRFIGELSFPVYICHFLIIDILTHFTNIPHQFLGITTITISILFSIIILKSIINPINLFRQSRI
ncbi:MAG: acyltransferase [Candidatus Shapirobacteria bacterium]|jgi:peptidoglycan/LPS O-acetylase OafA/YrhL